MPRDTPRVALRLFWPSAHAACTAGDVLLKPLEPLSNDYNNNNEDNDNGSSGGFCIGWMLRSFTACAAAVVSDAILDRAILAGSGLEKADEDQAIREKSEEKKEGENAEKRTSDSDSSTATPPFVEQSADELRLSALRAILRRLNDKREAVRREKCVRCRAASASRKKRRRQDSSGKSTSGGEMADNLSAGENFLDEPRFAATRSSGQGMRQHLFKRSMSMTDIGATEIADEFQCRGHYVQPLVVLGRYVDMTVQKDRQELVRQNDCKPRFGRVRSEVMVTETGTVLESAPAVGNESLVVVAGHSPSAPEDAARDSAAERFGPALRSAATTVSRSSDQGGMQLPATSPSAIPNGSMPENSNHARSSGSYTSRRTLLDRSSSAHAFDLKDSASPLWLCVELVKISSSSLNSGLRPRVRAAHCFGYKYKPQTQVLLFEPPETNRYYSIEPLEPLFRLGQPVSRKSKSDVGFSGFGSNTLTFNKSKSEFAAARGPRSDSDPTELAEALHEINSWRRIHKALDQELAEACGTSRGTGRKRAAVSRFARAVARAGTLFAFFPFYAFAFFLLYAALALRFVLRIPLPGRWMLAGDDSRLVDDVYDTKKKEFNVWIIRDLLPSFGRELDRRADLIISWSNPPLTTPVSKHESRWDRSRSVSDWWPNNFSFREVVSACLGKHEAAGSSNGDGANLSAGDGNADGTDLGSPADDSDSTRDTSSTAEAAVAMRNRNAERALFLHLNNSAILVVVDWIGGMLFAWFLFQHEASVVGLARRAEHSMTADVLQSQIQWLLGWPAGLKLNDDLDRFFGILFLFYVEQWAVMTDALWQYAPEIVRAVALCGACGGFTLAVSLTIDVVIIATLHVTLFYQATAKIFRIQLNAVSSLWKLFRGKKWNPLKERVDSCDFELDQLLVGTLFFTFLVFLLPTTGVYFLFFATLRGSVGLLRVAGLVLIELLTRLPVLPLILYIANSNYIPGGVCFDLHPQRTAASNMYMFLRNRSAPFGRIFGPLRRGVVETAKRTLAEVW